MIDSYTVKEISYDVISEETTVYQLSLNTSSLDYTTLLQLSEPFVFRQLQKSEIDHTHKLRIFCNTVIFNSKGLDYDGKHTSEKSTSTTTYTHPGT